MTVVGMVESAGRTIEGRGGEFSDSFGLLDVRVYRARVDRGQAMKNDDGLARTPPMGWRSWNSMLEDVSQETGRQPQSVQTIKFPRDSRITSFARRELCAQP